MEDSLNKSSGDNLIDLKLNEDLNVSPVTLSSEQGLVVSSLDQEDPKKKTKGTPPSSEKPKPKKVVAIKDSSIPSIIPEKGILDNIGKQIRTDTESAQPKLINKDLTYAAKELDSQIGYVTDLSNLDKQVAQAQGGWKQAGNAVARVGLKILPETLAQLGNALDFEDYYNTDDEVGNWLTNSMTKLENKADDALPIYRENPNKPLDVTDSAWWFENAEKLTTSIAGFAGAGFVTAGLVEFSTLRGAKALSTIGKLAKGAETGGALGASTINGLGKINTVAQAIMLNQAESVGIGLDTYNISYKRALEKLKADPSGLDKSNEQLDTEAKQIAANDASSAIAFNRWNIALNLTSASMFFKKPTSTRFTLKKEGALGTGKEILKEGGQEGLEENINDQSQNQALDENYTFSDGLKYSFTAKGLESSLLGFVGGTGNTILTKAGKFIPLQDNKVYRETYTNEYAKGVKNGLTEEEADAKAQQVALDRAGTNKKRISANQQHNQRYIQQQDNQVSYNERLANDNISDAILNLSNADDLTALNKELDLSLRQGDKVKADTLQSILVGRMAQNAFDTGTTEGLLSLWDGYANLTHDEATDRKMYKKGDENTPDYYKTKAKNVKDTIEKLEGIYNTSKKYINSQEYFDLQERKLTIDNRIQNNYQSLSEKFAQAEELYKDDKLKNPSFNKTYVSLESSSGFDINKVVPAFRTTQEYKDIKAVNDATKELVKLKEQYQSAITEVTSDSYQKNLKEAIIRNRERQASEVKNEKKEKITNEIKKNNLGKVKAWTEEAISKVTNKTTVDTKELRGDALPVVETKKEKVKPTNINIDSVKDTPRFVEFSKYDNVTDAALDKLKNDLSSGERTGEENLKDVQEFYNKLSGGREQLLTSFPLKAKEFEKDVETLKNTLDEIKSNLDVKSNTVKNLKQNSQELFNSLNNDEEAETDGIKDASPRSNIDFARSKKENDLMFSALDDMQNLGIDINDFKSVLTSFEENVGKDAVIKAFIKLKGLYIASTGNDVDGTYEDFMFTDAEKNQVINDFSNVKKFSIPQDIYISTLDPKAIDIINQHKEAAKLSDLNPEDDSALGYEIYNDTASDLLAYLSKKYELQFENRTSESGKPYIMVTKNDIDNLLNPNLDKRVLNPEFLKVGNKIRLVPLKSVTLEDGTILNSDTIKEEDKISKTPIGIEVNGEILKGVFLHDTDWINMTNTNLTAVGIEKDQAKSNLVRQIILNSGGIETTITNRTPGIPIVNTDETLHTVLEQTPNVQIGISMKNVIYNGEQSTIDVINPESIKEGQSCIVIPFGSKKLALAVSRAKLDSNYINSITTAVGLYLNGRSNDITKQLKEQHSFDILNKKGLEAYLQNFINVSNSLNAKTFEGFKDRINAVDDIASIISMVNGELMFGRGTGIRVNNISKSKYKDEFGKDLEDKDNRIATDIQALSKHLSSTFTNINLNMLGKEIKIPIITTEGKVEIEHDNYNDFAKANMYSKYMSMKLDDSTEIYTIQGKITYDIDSILQNNKSKKLVESVNEKGKTVKKTKVKPQQKSETIILPSGKTFNPDDVNVQDFSPILNDAEVSYQLKSVELLQSDKAKTIFAKGEKNDWTLDKMLSELQIPKEQKELLLNLENTKDDNTPLNEWLAIELGSLYSYSVEINTSKTPEQKVGQVFIDDLGQEVEVTQEMFDNRRVIESGTSTDFYSNLTVPGGTNYTENEIATPLITPSIKGHAQFSTDNGIGWFRSDESITTSDNNRIDEYNNEKLQELTSNLEERLNVDLSNFEYEQDLRNKIDYNLYENNKDKIKKYFDYKDSLISQNSNYFLDEDNRNEGSLSERYINPVGSKTRRILEVQSDLFQKGRDNKSLIQGNIDTFEEKEFNYNNGSLDINVRSKNVDGNLKLEIKYDNQWKTLDANVFRGNTERNEFKDFVEKEINLKKVNTTSNQFLQLLNKDNNWVTFFVKSIIQDSAKKGYEKILFPSGNTASKIEGHTTLEDFIKVKQDRINKLNKELITLNELEINETGYGSFSIKDKDNYTAEAKYNLNYNFDTLEEAQKAIYNTEGSIELEINQIKSEIENVEREGLSKLKPIYNFYENQVTNILKKQGYTTNQITDEYGNTWNEVSINIDNTNTISLAPLTNDNHDYLLENSLFIKGLTIGTQTSIIKTIANDIYNEFLEHTDKGSFIFDVKKQVDLAIQGFDLIKNNYIDREDSRAQFVAEQVDIIVENRDKILEAVRQILTPKIKDVSTVNYNDNVDDSVGLDTTDTDEIKIYSDKSEYIIDPRTKLSKEVKQFLEGIPQRKLVDTGTTKEYVTITNTLGLNNFISSDIVFNDIQSIVAKSNSNSGFNFKVSKIDEQFNVKLLPNVPSYVRNFVITLSKQMDSKPYLYGVLQKVISSEPHLQNAIISAFNKAHTHHIFLQSSYNTTTKSWSIVRNVAASRNVTNLILSQWDNNLSYSNIIDTNDKGITINKEAVIRFKNDYNKLASGKEDMTPQSLNNLLNQIGIDVPLPLFSVLNSGKFKQDGTEQTLLQSFNLSNGIFKNIYNRVSQFDITNSDALTLDTSNLYDDNSFRSLAKLIGRYTDNLFNNNFKNGNGDTVYGFSSDRYFVSRQLQLKTDVDLLTKLSSSVFSTGSKWLENLLSLSDDTPRINKNSYMYKYFEYYTGDSLKTKSGLIGKTIENFSTDELEKFNWGLYQNNGKHAGKGNQMTPIITVLYPTMEEKSNIFALQVPGKHYTLEENQLKTDDVKNLVRQLFYPEITRIRAFNQNPDRVNVKEYKEGGDLFLMFPILNYIHKLYDNRELNEDGSIKVFGTLKQIFGAEEESLLQKQLVNYFRSQAIERRDNWKKYGIIKTDTNGDFLAFVDSNYAKNFDAKNIKQLIYNYNINTVVANVNIQQLFISDIAAFTKIKNAKDYLKISKTTAENQTKRLAVDNAAANEILHEPNETFNLLVVEDVMTKSHPLVLDYLKQLWEGHKNYNKIIDSYSNITSTDAQEFTTLKEHVNMMFKEGKISEQQLKEILFSYDRTGKITEQNKKLILQPYKLRYGNNINRNGEDLRLHIKSSSFPLIEELTKGTPLDGLRLHMEANKIDRVAFASAVKVGQPLQLPTLFENEQFIVPENWKTGLIENIPRQGHGNQQENPYDENKNEVTDGSQQSKEIFTNILDVTGFKHPITGRDVTGRELSKEYHNVYNELFKSKYNNLIQELDYNQEKNTIGNLTRLKKLLKDEGVNRNYNANDIAGLELNERNTNFSVPLWLNSSGIKIESLLSSIVDNKVRKRLFRGKSLIMGSNVGTKINTLDTINKSDVVTVRNWDGTLKSVYNNEGVMTYAEVLAPFKFWSDKKTTEHPNGIPLKLEEFLNSDGTLDLNKLPAELLETFGYRIPTSGINLMSTIKIVGFLPNNENVAYGDILIAPDDFINQMGLDFDVDKLYTHMYNIYYSESTNSLRKIDKVISDFLLINKNLTSLKSSEVTNAYLENILLDTHKSVLNNPDKEVQQARTKPLSFGDLPALVEKFDVKAISKYFTPMSNMYQQDKYISARAGKAAVGVFSLHMVFNSVVQHIETPMEFYDVDGKTSKAFKSNLFGQANKTINSIKTIKGDKYKSDVIEAFMASGLDNGNEQLLGNLNINNQTFDFVIAALSSGYDENIIATITMQPVILAYVEGKELNTPIKVNTKTDVKLNNITLEEAQEVITSPDSDKSIDTDLQKAIFKEFLRFSEKGAELKRVQSAINSDSSGVGKNIFYSIEKARQITQLPNDISINSIGELIGDYKYLTDVQSQEELDTLKSDGYILYNGTLIKPNSLGGFAGVYATLLNSELWNKYFPYNNEKFKNITNYSLKGRNDLKDTLSDKAKQNQQISENYKSLLISNTYGLFGNYNSITEARQSLLYDTETNQSLGSIITQLKEENRKDSKNGYTNLLLDRLLINRGKKLADDGKLPTTIEYYNSGSIEMDEQQVINSFIEMIVNNKSLGNFNSKELTTRDLANKLILQQTINGGIQRSNQFIKFIPFKYLQKLGYYDTLESTNNTFDNIISNDIAVRLRTQTIQHYPEQYYDKDVEGFVTPFIENNKIVGFVEDITKSLDIIITKSVGDRYDIWKFNSETNDYSKIDNLGYNGILEYDISKEVGKSNIYINQVEDNTIEVKDEFIPPISDSKDFLKLDRDRTQDNSPLIYNTEVKDIVKSFNLDDNSLSIEDKYRVILREVKDTTTNPILSYFADKLQDVVPYLSETPLYVDTRIKAKGIAETSEILGEPVNIKINPNAIKNTQEMGEVLVEEMTHAILKAELGNKSSVFTRNIDSIREQVKSDLIAKYSQEKYDKMVSRLNASLPIEKGIESDLLYSVYNNDEFVAAAIKNKTFQQYLNSTEATYATKSLWQKFITAIKDLLVKLGIKEDSNLEAVLHETINLFDKVNRSLHSELNTPKFIRTIDYLNSKFNLIDTSSNILTKGNSDQIAEFINKTIVNVSANVVDSKVILNYKTTDKSLSPDTDEFVEFGSSGELVSYIQSLDLRVDKLKQNIRKAKENNDLHKAELLQLDLDKELLKRTEIVDVNSAVALVNKAEQDLQVVETILKRPMSSEDIVYVKHLVNFWQNAKEFVFGNDALPSDIISGMYGTIESKARELDSKLFLIQKDFTEGFIKKYIGSNVDLDEMFEDYKDINGLQGNFRDISVYDNDLLTSMFYAVKEADIKATDESNEMLERHDRLLKPAVQVLKFLGNKEIFEPFMQKTERGKRTNQIITPYNTKFYSEKNRYIKAVNRQEDSTDINKYLGWLGDNSINTNLATIFPIDNIVTEEVEKARNVLKSQVGEAKYKYWFNTQEKKIKQYNSSREASIEHIIDDFNLEDEQAINENQKALGRYESWIRRNSPYHLEELAHNKKKFTLSNYNFKSQDFYEVLSVDEKHLDKNFSTIENNKALLDYYYEVKNVFDELRKYIPHYQIQDFLYGGIPSIEKSIIETFFEKGMILGCRAIKESLAKSVQSSFGDNSSIIIDPVTNDKVKQMRVSLIKNNSKEVNNYITQKKVEYLLRNKEDASKEKIKEFREDIIDEISKRNSFDLGKITKVFATLVLSHKHKARIEDDIKVINTVLDSYQETRRRPDGTKEVNSVKGTIERKDKSQSFLKTKESTNYFIGSNFYDEIKDEEGKGSIKLTPSEIEKKGQLNKLLEELEKQHTNNVIESELYTSVKSELEGQIKDLGKTAIYSKRGDNILKYIQLKLMGWNFLGGIANITFGWIANQIEGAGGQIYSTKDLRKAYQLVSSSMLKNATFNKVETETAKKIRNIMDKFDILKDASKELYSDSVKGDLNKKVQWLAPYNMNQRGEYINQSVLMIALFKNTKITTDKDEINLYDALDSNGNWNPEYGEKPEQLIIKTRIKLDQLVKKLHGNYDNIATLKIKKHILGRAGSQFRTFIFENIADRFQDERPDKILGVTVKGRYRSVADVYTSTNLMKFAGNTLTGILKNYSLGMYKGGTFEGLTYKDGSTISELDAANMRKVAMEATLALNLYLAMALLKSVIGGNDDDENGLWNLLFNQGVRLRTDLIMYVNPIELRNMAKDIIPAFNTIGEIGKWMGTVEDLATGNDEYTTGVNKGDSKFIRSTNKFIPFVNKIQSTVSSAEQIFDNNNH